MSKETPATPDYTGAAQATADASAAVTQSQTYANRPNQNTPWSQTSWSQTPTWDPTTGTYVNQWTQNTNLVPGAQQALDSQIDVQKNLSNTADNLTTQAADQITKPVDWSGFTPINTGPSNNPLQTSIDTSGNQQVGSADNYANKAADAAWNQYNTRNAPLQQQAQQQLRTQLYNSGLREGDAAYDSAMKNLTTQQSDANTNASLAATQTGITGGSTLQNEDLANNQNQYNQEAGKASFANTAAGQTFNQGVTSSNINNTARQQQISEDLQSRGFTVNEINALLNGQQVQAGATPTFNAAGASAGANLSGALTSQYGAELNQTNAQNAQTNQTIGSGIALAALLA